VNRLARVAAIAAALLVAAVLAFLFYLDGTGPAAIRA
jgi:hypothetical protein